MAGAGFQRNASAGLTIPFIARRQWTWLPPLAPSRAVSRRLGPSSLTFVMITRFLPLLVAASALVVFFTSWTLPDAAKEHLLPALSAMLPRWDPDFWQAAAVQVPFDECDFNAARIVRSTTVRNLVAEDATPAAYVWRVCDRGDLPGAPGDLYVNISFMKDNDWEGLGQAWQPDEPWEWQPGGHGILQGLRGTCGHQKNCEAAWRMTDLAAELSNAKNTYAQLLNGHSIRTLQVKSVVRPYAWSIVLWLDRVRGDEPSHCQLLEQNRPRRYLLEIALIPSGGSSIASLEFIWDTTASITLLAVWAAAKAVGTGSALPLSHSSCDLYFSAYAIAVVAGISFEALVPRPIVAVLCTAACFCALAADAVLVLGLAIDAVQRRYQGSLPPLDHGQGHHERFEAWLLLALAAAALLPVSQRDQISAPGFFLCVDGGPPIEVPVRVHAALRLLPFAMGAPPAAFLWRRGFLRRPLLASLAYLVAPAVAWILRGLLAPYFQRPVQLLVALLGLRTPGTLGLLFYGFGGVRRGVRLDTVVGEKTDLRFQSALAVAVGLTTCVACSRASYATAATGVGMDAFKTGSCKSPLPLPVADVPQQLNCLDLAAAEFATAGESATDRRSTVSSTAPNGSRRANLTCIEPDSMMPAEDANGLHVVYACAPDQIAGLQASIASVIASSMAPRRVTVHLLVLEELLEDFLGDFGLPIEADVAPCLATMLLGGSRVRIHPINRTLVSRAVAHVPQKVLVERGAINSVENFARFYMHVILEHTIVIYLDTDTIVQADLFRLQQLLSESGQTIGFVAREGNVTMDNFLRSPQVCDVTEYSALSDWSALRSKPAYNVGVLAVNLKRWAALRVTQRIEALVTLHNACDGGLWIGGSQAPLLLVFLSVQKGSLPEYTVFDAAWNGVDLGWKTDIGSEALGEKLVLHWNGKHKPWLDIGLHREVWMTHCQHFAAIAQLWPTMDAVTTTLAPREVVARVHCPVDRVELMDEWTEGASRRRGKVVSRCRLGDTFGCSSEGMWTERGCLGLFNVSGKTTPCGCSCVVGARRHECSPGKFPEPESRCGLMILTSFFTTKQDWQRRTYTKADFSLIHGLYKSATQHGLNVTFVYDKLPASFLARYASARFAFEQVSMLDYDWHYGVNDVRYFFYYMLIKEHPEWKTIFLVDAFDVQVRMNPCARMAPDMLYVGSEEENLDDHPWIKRRFERLGGEYMTWYNSPLSANKSILNCGLIGGHRWMILRLLGQILRVLSDTSLAVRVSGESINLNMAALNYVVYTRVPVFSTGEPLHSPYKAYDTERNDVWFVHK